MSKPQEGTVTSVEAARLLRMSRPTFYTFAKKHDIFPLPDNRPNLERPARLLYRYTDIEPYIVSDQQTQMVAETPAPYSVES